MNTLCYYRKLAKGKEDMSLLDIHYIEISAKLKRLIKEKLPDHVNAFKAWPSG